MLFCVVAASTATGQTVGGQVVQDSTRRAVPFADVALLDTAEVVVRTVAADSSGSFFFRADPGRYKLRASRIGYATVLSGVIELRPEEPVIVELVIAVEGFPLEPLIVKARGIERGRDAWARRRQLGTGVFLDRDSIALREPRFVWDAFRGVKGIIVDRGGIRAMAGYRCMALFVNLNANPYHVSGSPGLGGPPRLALGGQATEMILPSEIEGIEVYHTFWDIPEELRTAQMIDVWPCGVAIAWTRVAW